MLHLRSGITDNWVSLINEIMVVRLRRNKVLDARGSSNLNNEERMKKERENA